MTLGLEQVAHPFRIRYAERFDEAGSPWYLEAGDFLEVLVDGELLVDGFVDSAEMRRTAAEYSLEVSGRARTADMVDCTAMVRPRQWANATVDQIVAAIAQPFGFTVQLSGTPGKPIRKFTLDKGETAFDAISRVCKMRGFWPSYDGGPTVLKLAKLDADVGNTALVLGRNVLEMTRTTDWTQRFSAYHFRGTTHATDDIYGVSKHLQDVAHDTAVDRYRPTRLQMRGADGPSDAGQRALFERNRRAGASERVVCQVSGWRDDDGALWRPNTLASVTAEELGLDAAQLLIVSAKYEFDERMKNGFRCELELKRREALDPEAEYPYRERRMVFK